MAKEVKSTTKRKTFFGAHQTFKYMLPDKIQFLEHKKLNEGERKRYQDSTGREMKMDRAGNRMSVEWQPGSDRHALIQIALVGWLLFDETEAEVPFSQSNKDKVLRDFDPDLIDGLEKDIKKANPWMEAEEDVTGIDEQIDELNERKKKIEDSKKK